MKNHKQVKKIAEAAYKKLHENVWYNTTGKDSQELQASVLEQVAIIAKENADDIRKTYGLEPA